MSMSHILDNIYNMREDKISSVEEGDKKNLKDLLLEREQRDERLEIALYNIPEDYKEIINNLKRKIEDKLEIEANIDGYFSEKAYKIGFSDAVNLILECKIYANNYENKRNKKK